MANDLDLRLSLGESVRRTLHNLQDNERLNERTQTRLATGKRINSITDGAIDYFREQGLRSRVDILLERKDEINQAVSALQTHLEGLESFADLLGQMRGQIAAARSRSDVDERITYNESFRELGEQLIHLVNDTEYNGLNLLSSENSRLVVRFSDDTDSRVDITGRRILGSLQSAGGIFTAASLFVVSNNVFNFSAFRLEVVTNTINTIANTIYFQGFSQLSQQEYADVIFEYLGEAERRLEAVERHFGQRTSLLQARESFTENFGNELQIGADKIALADLNEEAANAKALEVKHQIGVTSLTNAYRSQQQLIQLLSGR